MLKALWMIGHSFFDHQLMWQRCIICPAFTLVELTYAAMGKMASWKCVLLLLRWGRASQCKRSSLFPVDIRKLLLCEEVKLFLPVDKLFVAGGDRGPRHHRDCLRLFPLCHTKCWAKKKKNISEVKMQNRTWVCLNRPDATLIADEYLHFPFVCWFVTSQLCNGLKTSSAACEL